MTPRILSSSLLLAAVVTVGACASGPRAPRPSYQAELEQLAADCRARGGILAPIPGAYTGRPQTENVCEIRNGGGRLRGN
jgi:hypothetical protein